MPIGNMILWSFLVGVAMLVVGAIISFAIKMRRINKVLKQFENGSYDPVVVYSERSGKIHRTSISVSVMSSMYKKMNAAKLSEEEELSLVRAFMASDNVEIAKEYIQTGFNIHFEDDMALKGALFYQRPSISEYLISLGCEPQKFFDDEGFSEEEKEWARKYINARNLANKLKADLQPKIKTKTGKVKI